MQERAGFYGSVDRPAMKEHLIAAACPIVMKGHTGGRSALREELAAQHETLEISPELMGGTHRDSDFLFTAGSYCDRGQNYGKSPF